MQCKQTDGAGAGPRSSAFVRGRWSESSAAGRAAVRRCSTCSGGVAVRAMRMCVCWAMASSKVARMRQQQPGSACLPKESRISPPSDDVEKDRGLDDFDIIKTIGQNTFPFWKFLLKTVYLKQSFHCTKHWIRFPFFPLSISYSIDNLSSNIFSSVTLPGFGDTLWNIIRLNFDSP